MGSGVPSALLRGCQVHHFGVVSLPILNLPINREILHFSSLGTLLVADLLSSPARQQKHTYNRISLQYSAHWFLPRWCFQHLHNHAFQPGWARTRACCASSCRWENRICSVP